MQNKRLKQEVVLLAVPAGLLLEAGIFEGDAIVMYTEGRKLVIENDDDIFSVPATVNIVRQRRQTAMGNVRIVPVKKIVTKARQNEW